MKVVNGGSELSNQVKCNDCSGHGDKCLAGHSAHPRNWYKCVTCDGTGKVAEQEEPQEYNSGHCIEGLDRCHTIMVMIQELLDQHPAVIKAGVENEIGQASGLIMDAYQKIGELDD